MKKGALNLSIQAIVIVVIAFVVLGLGLTFVTGLFDDITKDTKDIQANIRERVLEDLRASGNKLSITKEINLERGKQTLESVGIVNVDLGENHFGILIEPIKKQVPGQAEITDTAQFADEVTFFYSTGVEEKLGPTEGDVIPVTITATNQAAGNYLYKVTVLRELTEGACASGTDQCEEYDSDTFFVRVS